MGYNAEDLDKMYLFCRQHFLSDLAHLDEIDEFWETYSEENAICEYTKDSFVFRLLSKIFRNEDTDGIYNFRCYIKDLCKQLDLLSEKQKKSMLPENEIILYRGKKLPLIVLQQLKELYDSEDVKDKLISINGFLSTTRNQEIANIHAGFDGKRDGYESVLFILKIDREMITAVSYASISHISCFPQEEEFLFSMGSVWQLMNMVCIDAKLTIELKLSNLFDTSIANLPKELSVDQSSNNCYLFLFAKILHKLGKYSQAVEHYNELLLNELSNKFKRLIHLNLATIRNELGLYTDAQKHLDEILYLDKSNAKSTNETSSSSLQSIYAIATMPSRLIILNNMGVLYQKKNETQKARNSFEEALKEQGTLIETSMVYNNLGNLENICRNIKKAHPYLEKAAKLAENSVWSHKFKQDLENVERQLKKNKLKNQNGTNLSPNEVNFS
jgi:tetratricopeptide (TPR) repeat protein